MRYVLDASVAASWCFHDENDPRSTEAFDLLLGDARAIVPLHWWFEIRNVVMIGARRNRITENHMSAFLGHIAKAPIDFDDLPKDRAILDLAARHRLSFYDAAYLELAAREALALATLDEQLAKAARLEKISLIGAA